MIPQELIFQLFTWPAKRRTIKPSLGSNPTSRTCARGSGPAVGATPNGESPGAIRPERVEGLAQRYRRFDKLTTNGLSSSAGNLLFYKETFE